MGVRLHAFTSGADSPQQNLGPRLATALYAV
jgi:hypothetical protein